MELPKDIENIIYLDNAATVFPKPPEVFDEMIDIYKRFGVNPGRSGYDLCLVGGDIIQTTREELTRFFGGTTPDRLCFAYNASDALNILIQGLVDQGDHVITTVLEHNSVIRPLNHLQRDNVISLDYVPCDSEGWMDPGDIARRITSKTKLVVVNHGSNVIGTVQPIAEIGRICREKGILFVIDTAQTAGVVPINVEEMCVDALAFTGHKSLLAPMGIGGLYVRDGVTVKHTRAGGTGVKSAYPYHLEEYPFRLEVGTNNVLGIVGLHLAQAYLAEKDINKVYQHEMELFAPLQEAAANTEGVTIHGTTRLENRLPVMSFSIAGRDAADVGTLLDVDFGIATRTGLHCAPLIHEHMGTAPRGTVRMSVGPMNTREDVNAGIEAICTIAADAPK